MDLYSSVQIQLSVPTKEGQTFDDRRTPNLIFCYFCIVTKGVTMRLINTTSRRKNFDIG